MITGAAAGSPQVKALVYVAAFAPDAGETLGELYHTDGPAPFTTALAPDAAGFVSIDRATFHDLFAKDVPEPEACVMAAAQKPGAGSVFDQAVDSPAWKTIPSWDLVAQDDLAIKPELQRFMAHRMGAKTSEIKTSHVPFICHPTEVANLIEAAASAAAK